MKTKFVKMFTRYDWLILTSWVMSNPKKITFDPTKAELQTARMKFIKNATFKEWFFADDLRLIRFLLVFAMILCITLLVIEITYIFSR